MNMTLNVKQQTFWEDGSEWEELLQTLYTQISTGNWNLTYWLHSRKACITHAIQEAQASQGRNQVHNQMVIHQILAVHLQPLQIILCQVRIKLRLA